MTVMGEKETFAVTPRRFANSKSAVSFSEFLQINVFHHIIVHFVVRLICCEQPRKYVRNNSLGIEWSALAAIFQETFPSNRTILVVLHFLTNRRFGLRICGFECNYIAPLY